LKWTCASLICVCQSHSKILAKAYLSRKEFYSFRMLLAICRGRRRYVSAVVFPFHISMRKVTLIPFLTCFSTFLTAENTQKVAKNLDYNNKEVSAELSKSHVDVLVPEILQVAISSGCDRVGTWMVRHMRMSQFPTL
jgi:hypothetical protein